MIDKNLLTKFWKDYHLITQEEREDFPIVMPAEAAKHLIRCRNWVGVFTEALVQLTYGRLDIFNELKAHRIILSSLESYYYGELISEGTSTTVLKTKELAHALISNKASNDPAFNHTKETIRKLEITLNHFDADKEVYELLLKKLERTTEWLIQFINWSKFELRDLNNG